MQRRQATSAQTRPERLSKAPQSLGAPAVDGGWYDLLFVCCPYTCRRLLRWRRIETQGAHLG